MEISKGKKGEKKKKKEPSGTFKKLRQAAKPSVAKEVTFHSPFLPGRSGKVILFHRGTEAVPICPNTS